MSRRRSNCSTVASAAAIPRGLWIDVIAHVVMGRDKRRYRFVQDTYYGRKVLAESNDIREMTEAITHYVASRMIERERALAENTSPLSEKLRQDLRTNRRRRRWRVVRTFLFGLIVGGDCGVSDALGRRATVVVAVIIAKENLAQQRQAAHLTDAVTAPSPFDHGTAPRAGVPSIS